MTDWFDKKENGTPESTPEQNNASPAAPEEKQPAAGWSSPASSVVPPASFGDSGESAPASSAAPAGEANNVTYRYGVNAPSPVPSNASDSAHAGTGTSAPQNAAHSTGGYQPQGNYNPYGWQQPSYPGGAPSQPPKKPKKKGATVAIATLSVVCAALIVTLSVLLAVAISDNQLPTDTSSPNSSTTGTTNGVNENAPTLDIQEPAEEGLATPAIVQKNLDSAVVITMYQNNAYYGNRLVQAGAATGIIWTADGYIITNAHVVYDEDNAKVYDRIDVETYDGTLYEGAQIVGYDTYTDLAVIKVDAENLSPAEFGDSSQLQLGDRVVAIGNAGGLNWTVTQGIISGLARDVYEDTGYAIKCLQVDAAINPGNSGGPLMNSQGQVVAINSAKIAAQDYEGLGFSIPINEAKTILDDLVKYGYVKGRVMLGISGSSLYGTGFLIQEIQPDSCLAGTEAQAGDVITAINGTTIADFEALQTELSKYSVGDTIELTLLRYDNRTHSTRELTVQCTLIESTLN